MWSNKYVGIPYKANGRDETGLDCWGLARLVYSEQFNINLPSFSTEYSISDNARIEELIDQYREGWKEETTPEEGCVVLFRILGAETHIGIAISNTHFIHVREGMDVAIESFSSVKWAKRIGGYYKYSTGATLNAIPHPLKTERITVPIPEGTTLTQLYDWVNKECNISPELAKIVHIIVNTRVIPKDQWDTTILKDTDVVEYRAVPEGGSTGRLLMTLALVVAIASGQAWLLSTLGPSVGVAGAVGSTVGLGLTGVSLAAATAAANMGAMMVGGALINAIAPIRPPTQINPAQGTSQLMITGAANQINQYGAIPVVLGKMRITPPVAAASFMTYGGLRSKTAVVYAFKASPTIPGDTPGSFVYTFSTGVYMRDLSYFENGSEWFRNPPTGVVGKIWVVATSAVNVPLNSEGIAETVASKGNPDAVFAGNVWSTPIEVLPRTGSLSTISPVEGLQAATVILYQRTALGVSPSLITYIDTQYNFSSKTLTGIPSNSLWTTNPDPTNSTGELLWSMVATPCSFDAVVSIPWQGWTEPNCIYEDATSYNYSESYLTMMLGWGYGPLAIDENSLCIGTTPLTNYHDVAQSTINYLTTPSETKLKEFKSIYSSLVQQEPIGVELLFPGYTNVVVGSGKGDASYVTSTSVSYVGQQEVTTTTTTQVTNAQNEPIFAQAIVNGAGGNLWTTKFIAPSVDNAGIIIPIQKVTINIQYPNGLRRVYSLGNHAGTTFPAVHKIQYQVRYNSDITASSTTFIGWTDWSVLNTIDPTSSAPVVDGFTAVIPITISQASLPFEIRIRRAVPNEGHHTDETGQNQDLNYEEYSKSILQSVTVYRNSATITNDPINCSIAKTAINIKATGQLNSQIQGINAIVQTYCLSWTGAAWVSRVTSNPADLFRYILQHPANPQRVVDSDIDTKINLVSLQEWSAYCTTKGFEYNSVLGNQRSVLEVLRDICAAGRASPALVDGKWTVVIDREKPDIIQHFSTHNSWGFESTKLLPKYPDGLKVQFYDEQNNYTQKEIIVYATGQGPTTAVLFETISLPGVTKAASVVDHARWHMAQIKLRPEIYTLNTDVEYLVCNRGDRVKVNHDVPMWGLGSGRIKNVLSTTTFELDEPLAISRTGSYTLRFRTDTGASNTAGLVINYTVSAYSILSSTVTLTIDTHAIRIGDFLTINTSISGLNTATAQVTAISPTTITYSKGGVSDIGTTALTGTAALNDGYYTFIKVNTAITQTDGDLFLFGTLNHESQDLIVLSIEPTGSAKSARLTLVDYGVVPNGGYNIFNSYADKTAALVFESNITLAPVLQIDNLGTFVPGIDDALVRSDESVMELISAGVFRYKIKVPYTNPIGMPTTVASVEGQIKLTNGDSANISNVLVNFNDGIIGFTDVQQAASYDIKLRYIGKDGRTGLWTSPFSHTVVGKSNPPSNVTLVSGSPKINESAINLSWSPCPEVDYASTIIKYYVTGDTAHNTWDTALDLFEGIANTYDWVRPVTNNYTILIRHKDTSGNLSITVTTVSIDYKQIELATIRVELSNPNPTIAAAYDGSNPVLTNSTSGTQIRVYEGNTPLIYDAISTANGFWRFTKADSAGLNSVATTITDSGDYATVGALQSFTDSTSGTVTYTITGKTSLGFAISRTVEQKFTKAKAGAPSYTWIAYADDASGTNFSTTAGTRTYVGIASNKTTSTPSVTYTDYTWSKIKGDTGATGEPGAKLIVASGNTDYSGSTNSYFKIDNVAQGDSATRGHRLKLYDRSTNTLVYDINYDTYNHGSGVTSAGTADDLASYLNSITNTNYIIVLISADACQCTPNLRAAINNKGGGLPNTWITGDTNYSEVSHAFIGAVGLLKGQGVEKIAISGPSVVSSYFTPISLVIGGADGTNGITTYTWIAYADDAVGTNFSTSAGTRTYIGIATNKTTENPPGGTTYTAYTWSKIKGEVGADGNKTTTIYASQWSNSGTPAYTQAATYTWSNGAISAYPGSWVASAGAAPATTGYVLYQIGLVISDVASATSTAFNWSSAVSNSIGYREDGSIGLTGASARTAYVVNTSGTVPGSVTAGTGDVVPTSTAGTWSFTATSTLTAGQYMYQVDGIYNPNPSPGTITWGNPYLSNLKVGSLSALAVDTGNLTVSTTGSIRNFGNTGYAQAGFFLGYDTTAYKFSVGGSTGLLYDGSSLTVPAITISSTGVLTGIGTANKIVDNGIITVNANGSLNNAGTGNTTLPGIGQNSFIVGSNGSAATTSLVSAGLYKNGTYISGTYGRSYTLIKIARASGEITFTRTYDVYGAGAVGGYTAATLAADLNAAYVDSIIVVIGFDEPQGNRLTSGLDTAMYRCGASRVVYGSANFKYRASYILVGIGGCGEGNGAEAYQGTTDGDVNAWCAIGFSIVGGMLTGVSNSYVPLTLKDYSYTGDLDATKGAPSGTYVGGTLAETVAANALAVTNATTGLATKLSKSSDSILAATVSIDTATNNAGFVAGNLRWNTAGSRISGSGIALTAAGLVGYNSLGTNTFNIDATTGNATFKGDISGSNGSFAGSLNAVTGTFAGSLSAATGSFAGSLSAATGSFAGSLSAATGSFTGGVYGGAYLPQYGNNWPIDPATNLNTTVGEGFALTSGGLLIGNYTAYAANPGGGRGFFQITNEGVVNSPNFSITRAGNVTVTGAIYATSGTFTGTVNANAGYFKGAVYGGLYTAYAWPVASTEGGFYLGSQGLLLGNNNAWAANQASPGTYPNSGYFNVEAGGNIYAPKFSIVNGVLTLGDGASSVTTAATGSGITLNGSVVGNSNIKPNAVTASKIDITGTGATSGQRVVITDNLITVYDSTNQYRVKLGNLG